MRIPQRVAGVFTFGRVFAKHFRGGRVSQSYLKPFDLNPTVLGAIGKPFPMQNAREALGSFSCIGFGYIKTQTQDICDRNKLIVSRTRYLGP